MAAAPVSLSIVDDFSASQRDDPDLLLIIKYLEKGELPAEPKVAKKIVNLSLHMAMIDGMLYYIDSSHSPVGKRSKVVVPRQLRKCIMESGHASLMSGHFSAKRVYKTLLHTCGGRPCTPISSLTVRAVPHALLLQGEARLRNHHSTQFLYKDHSR